MTNKEMEKIKNRYNTLISIKQRLLSLNKKIEELEQEPIIRKYLDLQTQLENEKLSFYYVSLQLSNDDILRKIIENIETTNTNNIYTYIGTYQVNNEQKKESSSDFSVSYDNPNASYRLYRNIEIPSEEKKIMIALQLEFEQQNIVLYPPKGVNSDTYFTDIRNMYFNTAIKYGQGKALEKVLYKKNDLNRND